MMTSQEYIEAIYSKLGKGKQIARAIYSSWFKSGTILDLSKLPLQSRGCAEAILAMTDFSIDSTFSQKGLKWIQTFPDGLQSESVEIPMQFGVTLCLSSQVGCQMGCAFCETGRLGLIRPMSLKEIVLQLFHAKFIRKVNIRNLVFMGMGEPFDHFDTVKKAIELFLDPFGFALGPSRICVSTSGLVDGIDRFTNEVDPRVRLAVSVNGSNNQVRSKIMPVNKRFDMVALKEALIRYNQSHPKRGILVEYILLDGVTDELSHADELNDYLQGLTNLRINVIPYNPQSRPHFKTPSKPRIDAFIARLRSHGLSILLRGTKGEKTMAACGQLGNLSLRIKKALSDINK